MRLTRQASNIWSERWITTGNAGLGPHTAIGWAAGFGLGVAANVIVSNYGRWGGGPFVPESMATTGALLGATLATFQWQRTSSHLPGVGWWIASNTVGWELAGVAAGAVREQGLLLMGVISGLVSGAVIGVVLAWYKPHS